MMGLSWIGILALLTAGNEYGSVIAKNRKIVTDALNEHFTDKQTKKYRDMLLDITETGVTYSKLSVKMDAYLDENHEITNDERFAKYYLQLRNIKSLNDEYFKIVKLLVQVEVDNGFNVVNFNKNFEKEYRMFRLNVKLIDTGMKILEEMYGIHEEKQEEK